MVIEKKVNMFSKLDKKMQEFRENGAQISENLKIEPSIANLSRSDYMH